MLESRARYMVIPSVYMQIGITGARRGDLKVYTCTCYSPIHKKCCHGSVVFQILLHLERSPTGDDFLAAEPHLHTRLRHVILTIALPLSSFPLIASFTTLLVRLVFFPHHCTAMKWCGELLPVGTVRVCSGLVVCAWICFVFVKRWGRWACAKSGPVYNDVTHWILPSLVWNIERWHRSMLNMQFFAIYVRFCAILLLDMV